MAASPILVRRRITASDYSFASRLALDHRICLDSTSQSGSMKRTIVSLVFAVAVYQTGFFDHGPTSDEFATYASFLGRLSADGIGRVALANETSKLVAPVGESWTPAELRPDPPERASSPPQFVEFCGKFCAHDFMEKNLRAWKLKPARSFQFPFGVIPAGAESSSSPKPERIVTITVTRAGFDLWHRHAAFSYSFDCSAGAQPGQDAVLCVQMGDVFLQKIDGQWQVVRYSGSLV